MDTVYLKETVGDVLADALAYVAKSRPADPVQQIGNFLIKYADNQERLEKERTKAAEEDAELERLHVLKRAERKKQQEAMALRKEEEEYEKEVIADLKKTKNVMEFIPKALDYIRKFSGSSSVYLGKREAGEDEAEGADEDDEEVVGGESFVKYLAATQGDEFLMDEYLLDTQGVTFDAWKIPEKDEEEEEDEEEMMDPKPKEPQPVHIHNVLREKKVRFFRRIPRLGAFLAVPFKYDSCNTQTALDKAFAQMETTKPEGEEDVDETQEMRNYATKQQEMVICLDTLGKNSPGAYQDDHIEKIKVYCSLFGEAFERSEFQQLRSDVELLRRQKDAAKDILDLVKETTIRAEGDVSEAIEALPEDAPEELKRLVEGAQRLIQAEKVLLVVKDQILELRVFNVKPKQALIRVIQALLFILNVPPKSILDHKKASWSKIREFFTEDLFEQIHDYDYTVTDGIPAHATIDALRTLTDSLSPVVLYKQSVAVGVILTWINAVLEVREAHIAKLQFDKEAALEAERDFGDRGEEDDE